MPHQPQRKVPGQYLVGDPSSAEDIQASTVTLPVAALLHMSAGRAPPSQCPPGKMASSIALRKVLLAALPHIQAGCRPSQLVSQLGHITGGQLLAQPGYLHTNAHTHLGFPPNFGNLTVGLLAYEASHWLATKSMWHLIWWHPTSAIPIQVPHCP